VNLVAMPGSRALSLVATPDPGALDVGLTTKPCHENMITK